MMRRAFLGLVAALLWPALASAQDAVARVLLAGRPWLRPVGAAMLAPGVNAVAGMAYRWVALNRHRLPGGTPACSLPAAITVSSPAWALSAPPETGASSVSRS